METYICDCIEYLKSNEITNWIVTGISVIISGLLSWLFAKIYYKKSNSNLAKAAVIKPIINRMNNDKVFSRTTFNEIIEITEKYEYAFLSKKKQEVIQALIKKYNDNLVYSNNDSLKANILYDYFLQKLDEMNVFYKTQEIYDYENNEHIDWVEPYEFYHLKTRLQEAVNEYSNYGFDIEEFRDKINDLYNTFWDLLETHDRVDFFINVNIESIIKNSEKYKKSVEEYNLFVDCKEKLTSLI